MGSVGNMDAIDNKGAIELFQAQVHVYNHVYSFINSMSLKCAVQLGIPDIINSYGRPVTLSELVVALHIPKTRTACIHRLMRLLVHSGFFVQQKVHEDQEEEGYVLTPSSKLLLKNKLTSLSTFLLMALDPVKMMSWHFLSSWFQEGESTPFQTTMGSSFFSYQGQHPELANLFNEAMANDSKLMMDVVVRECRPLFEGLRSLVDVGGGTGTVSKAIAEAFPHLKCIVFDLPQVVDTLEGSNNLEYVGGDMFESIPHADAVLLKLIMHDWSDEECAKILRRCKEAIPSKEKGGRVIIIDIVVNDNKEEETELTETQLFFDMVMMVVATGRERNKKEWEKLIFEAGFTHYKITPALGLRSVIEVYP